MVMTVSETSEVKQPPQTVARTDQRPRRTQKLTAVLDHRRSVLTTGVDSTMEEFLRAIGELLRRAMAARKQGIELPTFLAMLRDQSRR